uniref:Uncharacterized protein n=1 Tax=Panagrellus redivivus TaxID=6233 RepID=A0A7E4V7E6_PANRE
MSTAYVPIIASKTIEYVQICKRLSATPTLIYFTCMMEQCHVLTTEMRTDAPIVHPRSEQARLSAVRVRSVGTRMVNSVHDFASTKQDRVRT